MNERMLEIAAQLNLDWLVDRIAIIEEEKESRIAEINAEGDVKRRQTQLEAEERRSEMALKSVYEAIAEQERQWKKQQLLNSNASSSKGTNFAVCHRPGNYQSNDT